MDTIRWGIIGCGDVTEVKSGPAFNKVAHSSLVAVMRRDREKARQYAEKHGVPRYYDDAMALIKDPGVNAVYIATPPSSHEGYALAAIAAGKNVYLEKPMALNFESAARIAEAAQKQNVKLSVAHYRREQPIFKMIKQLLTGKAIGTVSLVSLQYFRKPLTTAELSIPRIAWRVDPSVSGGGLFHDLAPHQLDLLYYFFGAPLATSGYAASQSRLYEADDLVVGNLYFKEDIVFNGIWFFNGLPEEERDILDIIGTKGRIRVRVFQQEAFELSTGEGVQTYTFEKIPHVQQPMIEKVVAYFLGTEPNPCSGFEAACIMKILDVFTASRYGKHNSVS